MKELFRYRELVKNLVTKDLKLKYRGSAIGFLWSLVNPLLLIVVYSFVFGNILKTDVPKFSFFLVVGILPWNFFSQSLTMAAGAIVDNGGLIRKVAVPMEVFPIATVLFALVQFMLALAVFLPMMVFFFHIPLSLSVASFFPVLLLHMLFTLGLSFIIATATVFYRDVRHFMEILLMLLFWLTPIVYETRSVPESLRSVVFLNPLSFFILSYQDIFYHQSAPSLSRFAWLGLLTSLSLLVGYFVTLNYKSQFAEEV